MDLGHAIFKGVLQGLTEFLPVSSTAHLIFTDTLVRLFGLHSRPPLPGEEEFYDILLHLGTLAAVIFYFRADLTQMLQIWLKKPAAEGEESHERAIVGDARLNLRTLPLYMGLSMVMTVGFILFMLKGSELALKALAILPPEVETISDFYFYYPQWVAFHLLMTGCLLFFTEYMTRKRPNEAKGQNLGIRHAVTVGLLQGVAGIFHGISRSGSTISAGLASGLDRTTATRYSFMLSIPTFLMAAVYEVLKLSKIGHIDALDWPVMLIGTVFSGVVGYFCVKYFIQYVARHSLNGFAYYCWAVGIAMLVFLNMAGDNLHMAH